MLTSISEELFERELWCFPPLSTIF